MDQEIRFRLTPDELKRARRAVRIPATSLLLWSSVLIAIGYAADVFVGLHQHANALFVGWNAGLSVFWGVLAFVHASGRRSWIARECSLQLTETGLAGTVNGKAADISWKQLSFVQEVDGFLVFASRKPSYSIAVPKANVADVDAVWAFLEDKLIAKRLLIRSSPRPSSIFNTAF